MEAADKKSKKKKANLFCSQMGLPLVYAEKEGDYMSYQNMCSVHMKANDLKQVLTEQDSLEDWVEDKISSLADDIDELHEYFMHGHGKGEEDSAKDKKPWKEDRKPEGKLTPSQKAKAKARAKKHNRPYPNQVDNMWAAQQ